MFFLILTFVFAAFEWWGEVRKNQTLMWITKPTTLICLILWVLTISDYPTFLSQESSFPLLWFVVGLVFCLAGDVFLMLPPEKYLLPGLIVFLIGHGFYIAGFKTIFPPWYALAPGLILAGIIIILFFSIYPKLARGLIKQGKDRMKAPVAVYAMIISLMLYAALTTLLRNEWHYFAAWFVSIGAVLFYISDIMNAWTRFVAPFQYDRPKIMVTYHLGQIALAVGATIHFVGV